MNPVLDELVKTGKIRITVGKQGDLVSLVSGQSDLAGAGKILIDFGTIARI